MMVTMIWMMKMIMMVRLKKIITIKENAEEYDGNDNNCFDGLVLFCKSMHMSHQFVDTNFVVFKTAQSIQQAQNT